MYKLPASQKSIDRIDNTQIKTDILLSLEERIKSKFLIPQFIENESFLIQYSKRCDMIKLTSESIHRLDDFLHNYFSLIFFQTDKNNKLLIGLEHGDFHYRNLLKDDDTIRITDIDLLRLDGYPFLDIIHFSVHLIRSLEKTEQFYPFEQLLNDNSYIYNKLNKIGFTKLSDLWLKYYNEKYINLYIQSRIDWFRCNQIVGDELEQIQKLNKIYNS